MEDIKVKMRFRSLKDNLHGVIDITVAISIGVVFAALMVIAYIIWTLRTTMVPALKSTDSVATNATWNPVRNSMGNITGGFDQTIKIIVIAILVSVLAIALSYLMMLRHE
jgi:hypothetical protein